MQKKSTKICGVFTLGDAWGRGHYLQSAVPWLHLVQAFITVMLRPLSLPYTKSCLGHSEGHYSSHYWLCSCSVRCPMELCCSTLYRPKESYIYIHLYMCLAVHMQVWTHDPCFIWLSPKRPKGGVWPSKRYTTSRILKTPIDHPYRLCWCSERYPMEFFRSVLYMTKESYIYIYLSCHSYASLNPWPMLYLIKSKEIYGWCLRVLCGMQHTDTPWVKLLRYQ